MTSHSNGNRTGIYRSYFESLVGAKLAEDGSIVRYETERVRYVKAPAIYTPDFLLPNGIMIECKGWFKPADRAKHLLIRKHNPTLDIRFVFENSQNKLSKSSKTTYAKWCSVHAFKYADKRVPLAWLEEVPNGYTVKD